MELNVRQKRILELLSINCRFSNKDIAKQVGVSEDTVEYQIDKLINKDKIAKFNVTFDYRLLGYKMHHILIKLSEKHEDLSKLIELDELVGINTGFGKYDLQLIAIAKNKKDLDLIINKIKKLIKIQYFDICKFVDFYKNMTNLIPQINLGTKIPTNQKNPVYQLNEKTYMNPKEIKLINLDDKDKLIIKELLENPRGSYQELSKSTGLNHETIRYRIKKYVEERFIVNFGLIHDFKKYGLYTNYFLLKIKDMNSENFKKEILTNENIFYSAKLDGEYNAIIYLLSKDPHELGEKMQEVLDLLEDNVISYDSLFFDKHLKFVQFAKKELK